MKRETLSVQKREITGKKVKRLRREGVLPANIYGPDTDSLAVELDRLTFQALLRRLGETELLDLEIQGESDPRPVLIHNLQLDPIHGHPIHVDFYQVNLKEVVEVSVPIEFVGESDIVEERRGMLLMIMNELPIKVLPTNIPHQIEVDISGLHEVGDQITVAELNIPEGVTVMVEDDADPVVKIDAMREAKVEEEEEAEAELAAELDEAMEGQEESTEADDSQSEDREESEE